MTQKINTGDNRNVSMVFIGVSLFILFFHFYRWSPMFRGLFPAEGIPYRLLFQFANWPLFDGIFQPKLVVIVLLAVNIVVNTGRSNRTVNLRSAAFWGLLGILAYFLSGLLLYTGSMEDNYDSLYIVISIIAYIMIMSGLTRLYIYLRSYWMGSDVFNKDGTSFPQQEKLIENKYSLHLRGEYSLNGQSRKCSLNFVNPRRGILIMGSPGSGKSWFVVKNFIRQLIEGGSSMFVYDFKYDDLTLLAYNHFLKFKDQYPANTKFYTINFDDLSRSHRCNCIDPRSLDDIADAVNLSRTILLSGNKSWANKQGDFWVESPINLLAAIIWFLRTYESGRYCTLPHAIELIHTPTEQLFAVLSGHPDVKTLISQFQESWDNRNMELLDGQLSSLKTPLGKLISPNLYYILSGNDFTLDINNPRAPKIFCLGGNAQKQEALAPVLSLYIEQMCKLVNQKGKYRLAMVCDEFATVRATSVKTIISTGRDNDIIPIIAFQDYSQLKINYSVNEAAAFVDIPGSVICGQVHGETAKMISSRFLPIMQTNVSRSYNSRDTSVSESEHSGAAILPATLSNLSSGEFVGITADDPDTPMELKAFHARIINKGDKLDKEKQQWQPLPKIRELNPIDVQNNYQRIRQEIRDLVRKKISRRSDDPESQVG